MEKENAGIIYKITSPSGRIYIGQTIDYNKRLTKYRCGDSKGQIKLYRSFNKYGIENHIFEIVEECDVELLNERERHYQDLYDVLNEGLNCLLTETNHLSGKRCKETCDKIKENNAKYWLGKHHSIKTKDKISKANTGKNKIGKIPNDITRNKMSLAKVKKVLNINTNEITTVKEICIEYNLNESTLRSYLNGHSKNPINIIFYNYKYLDNE